MSMINYASRDINCKIVYYGNGLGGKTTNLEYVYSRVNSDAKGKMISLATETERTLFFDFLPFALQYNKRDFSNAMDMEERRSQLNPGNVPDFEGVAIEGRGVFETLGAVSKLVVQTLS
jgi:signal recognition particle receptor subunit beta